MARFGSFETDREIYSGPTYTVYGAKKAGDPATEYAIKVFCLFPTGLDLVSTDELAPLVSDIETSCIDRVEVQRKAAAASKFVTPIFETDQDERGVWYATWFYPRSVNKIISGRVALNRDALEHIIRSIAQGALDMKRACGRSHGDILPSNVQMSRSEKLIDADVVLSDPLPGNETEAIQYELADLHSIGRILLQLVLQREIDAEEMLILPILHSPEWARLFGQDAARWLALCNRLLNPELSLNEYSLEKLEADLVLLKPKPPVSRTAVLAAAAMLVILGLAAIFMMRAFNYGQLLLTSDPPGAEIKLEVDGKQQSLGKTPANKTPLKIKLRKGSYKLRAEYPGLQAQSDSLPIKGREKREYQFSFPYGRVQITTTPASAAVELAGNKEGPTPYDSPALQPGETTFYLRAPGYNVAKVVMVVPVDRSLIVTNASLVLAPVGSGTIEFDSQPRKAKISEGGIHFDETPFLKTLSAGVHKITVQFEDWPPRTEDVTIQPGENPTKMFLLPHGEAQFKIDPEDAKIFINDKPLGAIRRKALRPGEYAVRVEQPGYETNKATLTIAEGKMTSVTLKLNPLLGFVAFTSLPPGATIFDAKTEKKLGQTKKGEPWNCELPPESYSFIARYEGLDDVPKGPVKVLLGTRVPMEIVFKYGTVQFDIEPRNAAVRIGDKKIETEHYRKAGPFDYRVELPDYVAVDGSTNAMEGRITRVSLRLRPTDVPIALRSDPPGAQFSVGQQWVPLTNGIYTLPWGTNVITAWHPGPLGSAGLEPRTESVLVDRNGRSEKAFAFNYATLEITNVEPEAWLFLQNKAVTNFPTRLYLKPDFLYAFDLVHGTEIYTNLPIKLAARDTARPLITLPELRRSYTNSIGMVLMRVMGMPKYPNGFWVGKYEVTRGDYLKVTGINTVTPEDSALHPVVMITPQQAMNFCAGLTQKDRTERKLPPGMDDYTLPTEELWEFFVADASLKDSITSVGIRPGRTSPVPTDAVARGANRFGIYDVRGNVYEMCTAADGTIWMRGGAYDGLAETGTFPIPSLGLKYRRAVSLPAPFLGFRVVCVPVVPSVRAQK